MGAPKGNLNAEKWLESDAISLMESALNLTKEKEGDGYKYDFIGEVARDLGTHHHALSYLAKKFESCKEPLEMVKMNLEANCFFNTKKGNIREATGIVNLKSNYKWTDRVDQTTKDEKIEVNIPLINWVEGEDK